jgi:uncharacterized protein (TIGR02001 family)
MTMIRFSRLASLAALVAAALAPAAASAEGFAFNVGAVTDYRYRGLSQSQNEPALQGGVDFAQGGFYVGTWASTIKWIEASGGDGNLEIDLYGGYKGSISADLSFDVGLLTYQYLDNDLATSANTNEAYGAVTFGPLTAKYSYAFSNLFGNANSKGSSYIDLSGTFEWNGLTLTPHIGYQKVENIGALSYTDYSFTVSKEYKGIVFSGAIVGTDLDFRIAGEDVGDPTLVLGLKYNF